MARLEAVTKIEFPAVASTDSVVVRGTRKHQTKMKIQIGSIVVYVLNESDVDAINSRRTDSGSIESRIASETWPLGAQAHIGNTVQVGDICPAAVTRVLGAGDDMKVNLQVLLDGCDTHWATSRPGDECKSPGTWHWPDRG